MQYQLIVIGTSLGGFNALRKIFSALPKNFPVPIVVVQHRDKESDETFTQFLQKESKLIITETHDKDPIRSGFIYVAPADYHVFVEDNRLCLSLDSPVKFSRPSIDVLFESAAREMKERLIGIILTGANCDGAEGLAAVKARGGFTMVQDPKSAEAPRMPEAAIEACRVDQVVPLEKIVPVLKHLVYKKQRNNSST
ncbi:MAG: chemotaxis protein CheB [Bacteroidota bacterium]|nr:chemotaxis protein CheB [Bacteroidota bacterium]